MKTLIDHLVGYAAYHRERRNIATHFVGVPMIVVAVAALLSRPALDVAGLPLSPALLAVLGAMGFYLALDLRYGLAMAAFMGGSLFAGARLSALPTSTWLAWGVGLFVVGWIIQFVGHVFEGRKPAFVDDLLGLLIGPLFIVAEAGFALGLRDGVRREIEARVGPTRVGRSARVLAAAR